MNDIMELEPGESAYCYTEIFPSNADNKNVFWSVDKEDAAYIDQDGNFTALEYIPDEDFGGICYVEVTAKATDGSGAYGTLLFEIIESYNGNYDDPDNPYDYTQFGEGNFRTISSLPIYPEIDADYVFTDGEFFITFDPDENIELDENGYILICDEDGNVVDEINFNDEHQTVWPKSGIECYVGNQMVYVKDNVLYFSPHYETLQPSTKYFIKIPTGAIRGYRGEEPFTGIGEHYEWGFKTKYETSLDTVLTVNNSIKTTRQNFRTIGGALRSIANGFASQDYVIKVAPGEYHEIIYADLRANVTIEGQGTSQYGFDTVVYYNNNELENPDEDCAAVFYTKLRKNLVLKNIKIENRQNLQNGNAEKSLAIMVANNGGFFAAGNCGFSSVYGTAKFNIKTWLYSCFIEGNTDLVYGTADTVLLEKCYVKTLLNYGNAKLFQAMTGSIYENFDGIGKGIVLFDSELTTDKKDNVPYFAYASSNAAYREYYDQTALIDVKLNENYYSKMGAQWDYSILPLYIKKDSGGNMNVGWKSYGCVKKSSAQEAETALTPENNKPYSGTILDDVYALEYNGRRTILNRSYYIYEQTEEGQGTLSYGTYKYSDNGIDEQTILTLEEYFNATEDKSKNNDYSAEVSYPVVTENPQNETSDEEGVIEGISVVLDDTSDIEITYQENGQKMKFTASDGFKSYTWQLDGDFKALGKTYELDTQQLKAGTHVISVRAEKQDDINQYFTTFIIIKE
jgi:hypothetical protein